MIDFFKRGEASDEPSTTWWRNAADRAKTYHTLEANRLRWASWEQEYPEQVNKLSPIDAQTHDVHALYQSYGLLYIKPSSPATSKPVVDELTRKMTAQFRNAVLSPWAFLGFSRCCCGVVSTAWDYFVAIAPEIVLTNSLCAHYLAYHRREVPEPELARVARLGASEVEPRADELVGRWNVPELA